MFRDANYYDFGVVITIFGQNVDILRYILLKKCQFLFEFIIDISIVRFEIWEALYSVKLTVFLFVRGWHLCMFIPDSLLLVLHCGNWA